MPRRVLLFVALVLSLGSVLVFSFAFPEQHRDAKVDAQSLAAIDKLAAAEFARHPLGSITVGVVSGPELRWTKSYGDADMETKRPADRDTIYRIGSITKMFTALMLEQLVDAGKVRLSDPVERYFPEINAVQGGHPGAPAITLLQLATHTSGLDREPADTGKYVRGRTAEWQTTLIAALPHTRYIFKPGTHFSYSNIGYAILGAALARAADQPYLDYVPQHIFEPLGMTHTSLDFSPEVAAHLSKGYQSGRGRVDVETPQRELEGRGYKVPNGAIFTTVGDLARFASFLMGQGPESVLKTASLARYQAESVDLREPLFRNSHHIGFFVTRRRGYTAFGHTGAVAGYGAALYMNREAPVGVIVLGNSLGEQAPDSDGLALESLDLLFK